MLVNTIRLLVWLHVLHVQLAVLSIKLVSCLVQHVQLVHIRICHINRYAYRVQLVLMRHRPGMTIVFLVALVLLVIHLVPLYVKIALQVLILAIMVNPTVIFVQLELTCLPLVKVPACPVQLDVMLLRTAPLFAHCAILVTLKLCLAKDFALPVVLGPLLRLLALPFAPTVRPAPHIILRAFYSALLVLLVRIKMLPASRLVLIVQPVVR